MFLSIATVHLVIMALLNTAIVTPAYQRLKHREAKTLPRGHQTRQRQSQAM